MAPFQRRQAPLYWWVGPQAQPADLGTYLEAAGLEFDGDVPGMVADLRGVPDPAAIEAPASLTVARVHDEASIAALAGVLSVSYAVSDEVAAAFASGLTHDLAVVDNRRYYLARLDGEPVGATILVMAAGVAGIHAVGTVAAARGKGVASRLAAAALAEARAAGYRAATLQSSEMGFRVYQRLGFRQHCTYRHYYHPGAAAR
jgi:GNAT superfamily N-acetyltransferase